MAKSSPLAVEPAFEIHSRYNRPRFPGLVCEGPSMTQQHFRDETDINRIVSRAISTGNATLFTNTQRQEFFDASAFTDYRETLDRINEVTDDFFSLPSHQRKMFNNQPANYVAWMSNPANLKQAVELGLLPTSALAETAKPSNVADAPAGAPPEGKQPGSDA